MIKWKVVKRNRKSIATSGKYELTYEKGDVVEAVSGTLGIMCFDTKQQAIWLVRWMFHMNRNNTHILKVKPIGCGKRPSLLCCRSENVSNMDMFYSNKSRVQEMMPLGGTICYPKVKVLT